LSIGVNVLHRWNRISSQLSGIYISPRFFTASAKWASNNRPFSGIPFQSLWDFDRKTKPSIEQTTASHHSVFEGYGRVVYFPVCQFNFNTGLYFVSVVLPKPHEAIHPSVFIPIPEK
jgi:hypothetical protein